MSRTESYEVRIPVDRWSIRAISPIDIRDGVDPALGVPVIVHPAWGKSPERYTRLMNAILWRGHLPIAVDTRWAYSDRVASQTSNTCAWLTKILRGEFRTGHSNPYFPEANRSTNELIHRRPTSLLYACEYLGIKNRIYLGHSEGARISAMAALAQSEEVEQIIIVNGSGMGGSDKGSRRIAQANANSAGEILRREDDPHLALRGAADSALYAMLNARRVYREKVMIQANNTWDYVDRLAELGIRMAVFHANQDELVNPADAIRQAAERPYIDLTVTRGSHRNIFNLPVMNQVLDHSFEAET